MDIYKEIHSFHVGESANYSVDDSEPLDLSESSDLSLDDGEPADDPLEVKIEPVQSSNFHAIPFLFFIDRTCSFIGGFSLIFGTIVVIILLSLMYSTVIGTTHETACTTNSTSLNLNCTNADRILEEGSFWVDEKLERTNLTFDTPLTYNGIPLHLIIKIYNVSSEECVLLPNAWIDLWHCDPSGRYSDELSQGTLGSKWLRGYQITDSDGTASFDTVYPGWYSGRTVHIHVRIRNFIDSIVIYNSTTQLFFPESFTYPVYAEYPYTLHPNRDTTNSNDTLYLRSLEITMSGDPTSGLIGSYDLGVPFIA